jgi:antitoxin MazE
MITRIQKWGNSLGLRIPRSFALEARVKSGSPVKITVRRGRLVITALKASRYSLARLLRKIHRGNLHPGVEFGRSQSKELL